MVALASQVVSIRQAEQLRWEKTTKNCAVAAAAGGVGFAIGAAVGGPMGAVVGAKAAAVGAGVGVGAALTAQTVDGKCGCAEEHSGLVITGPVEEVELVEIKGKSSRAKSNSTSKFGVNPAGNGCPPATSQTKNNKSTC
uniref:Uncharacterized protein n=1 Tax=Lotharella globosa TaxID=91324 RepID=A0A7S3YP86_9EUKA